MTGGLYAAPFRIHAEGRHLEGDLVLPAKSHSLVIFAHGSGSSRHSPRNRYVARMLREAGIGTLLFDLLTPPEDADVDKRFDIALLTRRLVAATLNLRERPQTARLFLGYFGASTGAAAALQAAAELGPQIRALVSRGGRPDLAMEVLDRVQAPTLLIVGGYDDGVITWNQEAYERLRCTKRLEIVPGATHLFEEPGKLEAVAGLARNWFEKYLG
ncbi:MAG: dienelactone hydrolase family protein [Deltaproteobacteria bacterium]|nr:dienelactone hydrolase family protein [Deltaproteobacteria bacterium]